MERLTAEEQQAIDARVSALVGRLDRHIGALPAREEAVALVFEHTRSPSLRAHMLAVEASMAACAPDAEQELAYRLAGLLHDFDYEKHPHPTEHPLVGCEILLDRGYPRSTIEAILGHASYTGVPRQSRVAKTLFAVDELTGFLTAVAYVRPTGLNNLTFKSFKKKFKTPSFAAGVSREEVLQGAEELGVDLSQHVMFLAQSLQAAFPEFPIVPEAENT